MWSGNFFGPREPYRSIELKNFKNLLNFDLNFYSFQNEIWDRDKEFFKNSNLIDYSKESFVDIISIIQNLDLKRTFSNTVIYVSFIFTKYH